MNPVETAFAVLAAALVVGLLVTAAVGVFDSGPSEREIELVERVDSLKGELATMDSVIAAIDSAWAADSARRVVVRARADTVFTSTVDTIRAALPDTLHDTLDRLVQADSVEDAAYEADIRNLHSRVAARDSLIASLRATSAAQDTLVAHLRERLHPGFWEGLAGDLPETVGKVGAGVLLGAVLVR